MNEATPKLALAAREAHEALLELKKRVDDATETAQIAERESLRLSVHKDEDAAVRNSLQIVIDNLNSPDFAKALSEVRVRLEKAISIHQVNTSETETCC